MTISSSEMEKLMILYDRYNTFQLLMRIFSNTFFVVSSVREIPELLYCKAVFIRLSI